MIYWNNFKLLIQLIDHELLAKHFLLKYNHEKLLHTFLYYHKK